MRKQYLLGNWKMYKSPSQAHALGASLRELFSEPRGYEVAVFPPSISIPAVVEAVETAVAVGGQNMHWMKDGAMTGEISGQFLLDAGCSYVLVGHSERRQFFGETDETANRRVKAALEAGLTPVLCIGESLAERDGNETHNVVERHLRGGLAGLEPVHIARVIIAYEPVWAIGTGRVATPDQAEAVHEFARNTLAILAPGVEMSIVYGGSVKPDNAKALLNEPNIDGALVGGASLDAAGFAHIGAGFPTLSTT